MNRITKLWKDSKFNSSLELLVVFLIFILCCAFVYEVAVNSRAISDLRDDVRNAEMSVKVMGSTLQKEINNKCNENK